MKQKKSLKIERLSTLFKKPLEPRFLHQFILQACQNSQERQWTAQDAWWILESVLEQSTSQLITAPAMNIPIFAQKKLLHWLTLLTTTTIPAQYLWGSVPFCGTTIIVRHPVLIPRPETEEFVGTMIKRYGSLQQKPYKLLDLCTGTGCVAIAFGSAFPTWSVVGVNIAPYASTLAKENLIAQQCTNVTILTGDLYEAVVDQKFHIIFANPPYITKDEWQQLASTVKEWEATEALIGGHDGMDLIKRIIMNAQDHLLPTDEAEHYPQLLIEIGHTQSEQVIELCFAAGFGTVWREYDIYGIPRFICARVKKDEYTGKNMEQTVNQKTDDLSSQRCYKK